MTRIFRYILAHDSGMAPCIDNGVVTLATCKPQVRRSARQGDWVLGFMPGGSIRRGQLVWAGVVEQKFLPDEYERAFRGRCDAIYRQRKNGQWRSLFPDYHANPRDREKDVSSPVLLFEASRSWYFGSTPVALLPELDHLAPTGRGHRTNRVSDWDAPALEEWLRSIGDPGIHGTPREPKPVRGNSGCGSRAQGTRRGGCSLCRPVKSGNGIARPLAR